MLSGSGARMLVRLSRLRADMSAADSTVAAYEEYYTALANAAEYAGISFCITIIASASKGVDSTTQEVATIHTGRKSGRLGKQAKAREIACPPIDTRSACLAYQSRA